MGTKRKKVFGNVHVPLKNMVGPFVAHTKNVKGGREPSVCSTAFCAGQP